MAAADDTEDICVNDLALVMNEVNLVVDLQELQHHEARMAFLRRIDSEWDWVEQVNRTAMMHMRFEDQSQHKVMQYSPTSVKMVYTKAIAPNILKIIAFSRIKKSILDQHIAAGIAHRKSLKNGKVFQVTLITFNMDSVKAEVQDMMSSMGFELQGTYNV
jgi:hypothetical protein